MIVADLNPAQEVVRSAAERDAEREAVAIAGALIDKTLSWMRFPTALETQFLREGASHRLRYFMISGWLSLIVFNGFLLTDYLLAPDVLGLAVKVRLLVFTPTALCVLTVGTFARGWVLRHFPPLVLEGVVVGSGVAAGAVLAYLLSASHHPMSQYYHVGLMVVIIYGNLVQRLRFWYALIFSLAVYAMHVGGVLMVTAFNPRLIWPMAAMIGATVVFTLMANYAMERDQRRQYLLSLRRKLVLQDLADLQQRLQKQSRVDALTGVYNRRHFDEYLEQVWRRAQFGRSDVAIIMVDIDHFKQFNDHYGHLIGDTCLIQVAQAMHDSLRRPADLVARLGGEEFVALLPDANAEVATAAAERLRQAIEKLLIPHGESDTSIVVTISVGVGHCRPGPGQLAPGLIDMADQALYQAKHAGRNQVVCRSA